MRTIYGLEILEQDLEVEVLEAFLKDVQKCVTSKKEKLDICCLLQVRWRGQEDEFFGVNGRILMV